jgi:hypothetical protein
VLPAYFSGGIVAIYIDFNLFFHRTNQKFHYQKKQKIRSTTCILFAPPNILKIRAILGSGTRPKTPPAKQVSKYIVDTKWPWSGGQAHLLPLPTRVETKLLTTPHT